MRQINFSLDLTIIIFIKEIYIRLTLKINKFGEVSKVIKHLLLNFQCIQGNHRLIKKEVQVEQLTCLNLCCQLQWIGQLNYGIQRMAYQKFLFVHLNQVKNTFMMFNGLLSILQFLLKLMVMVLLMFGILIKIQKVQSHIRKLLKHKLGHQLRFTKILMVIEH